MKQNEALQNPRVIVIQKLYGYFFNKDSEIKFPKHRYKKFIKDVVRGTIERKEVIEELILRELKNDYNPKRTDILLKIITMAAVFELLYKPQTSLNIIINEYLSSSNFFLEKSQKRYLNAMLDKLSKKIRINNE